MASRLAPKHERRRYPETTEPHRSRNLDVSGSPGTEWVHASLAPQARPDTIDVWRFPLSRHLDDWTLLCDQERERAQRFIRDVHRDRYVAGRATLRRILGSYLSVPAERLAFRYGVHGKPGVDSEQKLTFNLSNSESVAVVAVGVGRRLGIDVERSKEGRGLDAIARRFFSEREYADWLHCNAAERRTGFYDYWACKESYLKAWATGLSFPSRRFTVLAACTPYPRVGATEMPGDDPSRWWLLRLDAFVGYSACLCVEVSPGEELRPRYWDWAREAAS